MDNPLNSFLPSPSITDTDFEDEQIEEKVSVSEWLKKIDEARKKEQHWRKRARQCVNIYRDDNTYNDNANNNTSAYNNNDTQFNILWANVETLLPALFSAIPTPDVRSRFLSQDQNTQTAALVIERCLTYSLDAYSFPKTIKSTIKDYLLTGRGTTRVSVWPEFEDKTTHDLDMDGNLFPTIEEVQVGNSIRYENIDYELFIIEPAKRWVDVTWICFENQLTEEEYEGYFPDKPLSQTVKDKDDTTSSVTKYQVYEIWDKKQKKVYFIGRGIEEPLKIMDDPLRLLHFWPIPQPLYSIETSDTLVPIPEYTIYQDLAEELNEICYRITDLVRSCKFIGVYDAQQQTLNDILSGRDSQIYPVQANLIRDGGIKSIMDVLDVTPIVNVLKQLYEQRDQVKAIIYEVTGISDIIRGESKASETATAQNIKASYAGLRLRDRRDNINRFIVELLRINTELIVQFITVDQMEQMSGVQITPEVYQILSNDVLRSYKIDIESDSTILADMDQQAQKRAAIVQSITQFISATAPLVAQGILPIETAKALMNYALQPTKISRELEDALDMIGQAPPPMMPPMNPMQQQHPQMPPHMPPHPMSHGNSNPIGHSPIGFPTNGMPPQGLGGAAIQLGLGNPQIP